MGKILYAIFKTARPRQWLKNVAIFSTLLFTGTIFSPEHFLPTAVGFIVFCFLASSNYLINDVLDAPSDRKHPFKRFRPVASGSLPIPIALFASLLFMVAGLVLSYTLSVSFFFLSICFVVLQYTYSLLLKKTSVIDILAITGGYIIRVYAGEAITGLHISVWLALAALSLSLFLAIGKRRSELTLIQGYKGILPSQTRETLSHYSEKLLDTYTAMFANSTFIAYAFYTFLEHPVREGMLFRGYTGFVDDFTNRKWMMITIPFVLYGIMRYMQLIYEGKGESPEKVLTSDSPLILTVMLWGASVLLVILGIGG